MNEAQIDIEIRFCGGLYASQCDNMLEFMAINMISGDAGNVGPYTRSCRPKHRKPGLNGE